MHQFKQTINKILKKSKCKLTKYPIWSGIDPVSLLKDKSLVLTLDKLTEFATSLNV